MSRLGAALAGRTCMDRSIRPSGVCRTYRSGPYPGFGPFRPNCSAVCSAAGTKEHGVIRTWILHPKALPGKMLPRRTGGRILPAVSASERTGACCFLLYNIVPRFSTDNFPIFRRKRAGFPEFCRMCRTDSPAAAASGIKRKKVSIIFFALCLDMGKPRLL